MTCGTLPSRDHCMDRETLRRWSFGPCCRLDLPILMGVSSPPVLFLSVQEMFFAGIAGFAAISQLNETQKSFQDDSKYRKS